MKHTLSFPVNAFLLIGPTGVGKSPLGDALGANGLLGFRCHHLDFGSELRSVVSGGNRSARYTDRELDFIHGVLERGLLLENEQFSLAQKIISLFLDRVGFAQNDVLILNGIPRHEGQARDMEQIASIHALIVLDCSGQDVFERIRDNVGGDRTERIDDNMDLIEKKLKIFRERTTPLIAYYNNLGKSMYRVRVTRTMTPADAYRTVSSLAAVHPPVTLVAEPPER